MRLLNEINLANTGTAAFLPAPTFSSIRLLLVQLKICTSAAQANNCTPERCSCPRHTIISRVQPHQCGVSHKHTCQLLSISHTYVVAFCATNFRSRQQLERRHVLVAEIMAVKRCGFCRVREERAEGKASSMRRSPHTHA